mmetsp:Transcript_11110/g.34470  ORF Transcript_11110/g.34470 Transcript_11110/m.34470 type:complete len:356 (-) Transcript_11110:1578-2645(-)
MSAAPRGSHVSRIAPSSVGTAPSRLCVPIQNVKVSCSREPTSAWTVRPGASPPAVIFPPTTSTSNSGTPRMSTSVRDRPTHVPSSCGGGISSGQNDVIVGRISCASSTNRSRACGETKSSECVWSTALKRRRRWRGSASSRSIIAMRRMSNDLEMTPFPSQLCTCPAKQSTTHVRRSFRVNVAWTTLSTGKAQMNSVPRASCRCAMTKDSGGPSSSDSTGGSIASLKLTLDVNVALSGSTCPGGVTADGAALSSSSSENSKSSSPGMSSVCVATCSVCTTVPLATTTGDAGLASLAVATALSRSFAARSAAASAAAARSSASASCARSAATSATSRSWSSAFGASAAAAPEESSA